MLIYHGRLLQTRLLWLLRQGQCKCGQKEEALTVAVAVVEAGRIPTRRRTCSRAWVLLRFGVLYSGGRSWHGDGRSAISLGDTLWWFIMAVTVGWTQPLNPFQLYLWSNKQYSICILTTIKSMPKFDASWGGERANRRKAKEVDLWLKSFPNQQFVRCKWDNGRDFGLDTCSLISRIDGSKPSR